MKVLLRVRRMNPEVSSEPRWQDYEVDCSPGAVVLDALHHIHETIDGSLAYRYSCRGAICGSCAMLINGVAALACKTQVSDLDTTKPIVLEPLRNLSVIKDLVVDQGPFFAAWRAISPWLSEGAGDLRSPVFLDRSLAPPEKDQYLRAADCIVCQCCFSDCPKRAQDPTFLGPQACLAAYKRIYHPQEPDPRARLEEICRPGGVFSCNRHANCVKVCPKDCRPMRAILMLQRRAQKEFDRLKP